MTEVQKWLDENYPVAERITVVELRVSGRNLAGDLDLSDFVNLRCLKTYENELLVSPI